MKLIDQTTLAVIDLPNDLIWRDELDWLPLVSNKSYSLTGALIIEQAVKQTGRPISLENPDNEMAWVDRSVVELLRTAATIPARKFKLVLEYPTDIRQFLVAFDHSLTPVEAKPVKGFAEHETGDQFLVKIKLLEVL